MIIATFAVIGVGLCAFATLTFTLAPSGPGRARAENNGLLLMAAGVAVLCAAAAVQSAGG